MVCANSVVFIDVLVNCFSRTHCFLCLSGGGCMCVKFQLLCFKVRIKYYNDVFHTVDFTCGGSVEDGL